MESRKSYADLVTFLDYGPRRLDVMVTPKLFLGEVHSFAFLRTFVVLKFQTATSRYTDIFEVDWNPSNVRVIAI